MYYIEPLFFLKQSSSKLLACKFNYQFHDGGYWKRDF